MNSNMMRACLSAWAVAVFFLLGFLLSADNGFAQFDECQDWAENKCAETCGNYNPPQQCETEGISYTCEGGWLDFSFSCDGPGGGGGGVRCEEYCTV